jgi:hypothetical protein
MIQPAASNKYKFRGILVGSNGIDKLEIPQNEWSFKNDNNFSKESSIKRFERSKCLRRQRQINLVSWK